MKLRFEPATQELLAERVEWRDVVYCRLGLRPDLTSRGLGLEFVRAGIQLIRERFGPSRIVLDVAGFNERAAKVYERAGFRVTGRHVRKGVTFIDMELAE